MIINPFSNVDIPDLVQLQPEGWNDIRKVFSTHIDRPYFEAFKGMIDRQLVAVGHTIYCGTSAWIGNIIVHENFRKNGFGKIITNHLIDIIHSHGIQNINLLATDLGRPVYRSFGFKEVDRFSFFRFNKSEILLEESLDIRRIMDSDIDELYRLDRMATGEDRSGILKYFLESGWVLANSELSIQGFYLPDLGDGLIVAENKSAGIILSKFRYLDGKDYVVLPDQNIDFLKMTGINVIPLARKAYFMHIGNMKKWNSKMIFSRVGGYLG